MIDGWHLRVTPVACLGPGHRRMAALGGMLGVLLAWLACGAVASAQPATGLGLRVTGSAVITRLETAQQGLVKNGSATGDARLATLAQRLGELAQALQGDLGADAAKPVDLIGKNQQGKVWRAHALAERAQAYLLACTGCMGDDARAMVDALVATADQLSASTPGSSATPPVIDTVQTIDNRPLFVLRQSAAPLAFALGGSNLLDSRCPDPKVTATDAHGVALDVQPVVTGVSPARIEVKLPAGAKLDPGAYVLHVVTTHKEFLRGCATQPEALAVLQVAQPFKLVVSYTLEASCPVPGGQGAAQQVMLDAGALPDITTHGATVRKQVTTQVCADPASYTIAAKVGFADGTSQAVGPFTQNAAASITAGLPGGLSLNWDPAIQTIVVHSGASTCKGVY